MSVTVEKPRIRVPARSALLASAAMPVIQFRGIGAAGKRPAADDDGDEDMKESDDKEIVGEDEDTEDGKARKGKKGKKAKARKADDETASEDDDPDDDGDDDDNDDEEDRREMRAGSPARAARLRERARIAAILESPAAAANLDFAVTLALTTDLPRNEAIGLLKAAPKAGAKSLGAKMEQFGHYRPNAGGVPAPKGQAAIDSLWATLGEANGFGRR